MSLTTADVDHLIDLPKKISEVIRWKPRAGPGRARYSASVRIIVPETDDDLELRGEAGISPSGQMTWAWAIRHLGENQPIRRVDLHPRRHRNPDGTVIHGCMLHLWDERDKDKWAIEAETIDCTDVNTALPGFLSTCNIILLSHYQPLLLPTKGGFNASM